MVKVPLEAKTVTSTASTGLLQRAKESWQSVSLDGLTKNLSDQSSLIVRAGVWFAGGFAVGYLFRKYFFFIFGTLLVTVGIIKWLEHHQALVIQWDMVKSLVGIDVAGDVEQVLRQAVEFVCANAFTCAAAAVGFLLGYRLG